MGNGVMGDGMAGGMVGYGAGGGAAGDVLGGSVLDGGAVGDAMSRGMVDGDAPSDGAKGEGFVIKGDVLLKYFGEDKRVRVPDGIRVIGEEAFSVAGIESVVLPFSLVEIGDYAFEDCSLLELIVIPEGVVKLGFGAFDGCGSLRAVTLPTSFKSIDDLGFAFADCCALERVNCGIDFSDCDDVDLSLAFAWGSPILRSIRRSLGRCASCGKDLGAGRETCGEDVGSGHEICECCM